MTYSEIQKPSSPDYNRIPVNINFLENTAGGYILLTNGCNIILRKDVIDYSSISKPSSPSYNEIDKPTI